MFDNEHQFVNLIEKQFDRLIREVNEVEAQLRSLRDVGEKNFEKILKTNDFEKYKRLVTSMSITAINTGKTFEELDAICVTGLEKCSRSYKKSIRNVQEIITEARKQNLSYATRLPFSFGEGWQPGNTYSTGRHVINTIGYLLVYPASRGIKGKSMYHAYLNDLKKLSTVHQGIMDGEKDGNIYSTEKEMRDSFKSLRVLIRTSQQIFRSYRKAKRECLKICKNNKLERVNLSLQDIGRHFESYQRWNKELNAA